MRFSLAAVFGLVTVAALALAALRGGDWSWARALFTVMLALLLTAVFGAAYRSGVTRAFWIGFAVFGWAYFLLAFVPAFRTIEHQLIGKEVYESLKEYAEDGNSGLVMDSGGSRIPLFSFAQIVHSTCTLAFAVCGGLVGAYFCGTGPIWHQEHRDEEPTAKRAS